MKTKCYLWLFLFYGFIVFSQGMQFIKSTKTKTIGYTHKGFDACNEDKWDLINPYRATILRSGEQVSFALHEPNKFADHEIKWVISRINLPNLIYTDNRAEIKLRTTPPITFTKNSLEKDNLFETYQVSLYANEVLKDSIILYLLDSPRAVYYNNFGATLSDTNPDDAHHIRAVEYPTFTGDFINKSGGHGEAIDGLNLFTTFKNSDENRSVETSGSLQMTAPAYTSVSPNNPLKYRSINKRNDVNFYPRHMEGDEYYYSISIKIPMTYPSKFFTSGNENKDGIANYEDGFYNIVYEFHQSDFPITDLHPSCMAIMHLILMDDSHFKINYGLRGIFDQVSTTIPYTKGTWVDFVFRVKWKQMYHLNRNDGEGIFESWYRLNNDHAYSKATFSQPSNPPASYALSTDCTTVYGPNLDNYNPPYITLNQYRLPTSNEDNIPVPFETSILFDDFKISKSRPNDLPF